MFSIAMAGVALLALGVPAAHADLIYNFTLDGCTGGCGPQTSFGTIDLNQKSLIDVQITVSLLNGNSFLTTGAHHGFTFNVLGGAVTVGPLPKGWVDAGGPVVQPGFGAFTNGIDCAMGNTNNKNGCAGSNPWVGLLQFDVFRASGLLITDFVGNGQSTPIFFSSDILSGTTGLTGAVAAQGNASTTPEPGTLVLLGSGILGLAGIVRRKINL